DERKILRVIRSLMGTESTASDGAARRRIGRAKVRLIAVYRPEFRLEVEDSFIDGAEGVANPLNTADHLGWFADQNQLGFVEVASQKYGVLLQAEETPHAVSLDLGRIAQQDVPRLDIRVR